MRGELARWPGSTAARCPSVSALASSLPSGLNATSFTPPPAGISRKRSAGGLPGDRVPPPHIPVVVRAGQQLAVRAERHPEHPARADQPRGAPTACPVAGFHSRTVPVGAGGGQQLAVRAERDRGNGGQGDRPKGSAGGLPGDWVPQPHGAAHIPAGQQLAVRAERHRVHAVAQVSLERRADRMPGGRVPQPHIPVAAGGGQQLAVRAERHHRSTPATPFGRVPM